MSDRIRTIEGIGPQAAEIFEAAGLRTIQDLRTFDCEDRLLWDAIKTKKATSLPSMDDAYGKRLFARCLNVLYRVRSAEADEFVPYEYMCPITLDWYVDPVVSASSYSYLRAALEEHLERSGLDPVTREDIRRKPVYANRALREATEHYRMHHQRFRIQL